MSAKQVLNRIGAPDFIGYSTWSYDMDASKPFTLTLHFDARKITRVERRKPAWNDGQTRDQLLAY